MELIYQVSSATEGLTVPKHISLPDLALADLNKDHVRTEVVARVLAVVDFECNIKMLNDTERNACLNVAETQWKFIGIAWMRDDVEAGVKEYIFHTDALQIALG